MPKIHTENLPHLQTHRFIIDPKDSKLPFPMPINLPLDVLYWSLQQLRASENRLDMPAVEAFYFALRELNRLDREGAKDNWQEYVRLFSRWGRERVFRNVELQRMSMFPTATDDFLQFLYDAYLNLKAKYSTVDLELPPQQVYFQALVNSGYLVFPHLFHLYMMLHVYICHEMKEILLERSTIEAVEHLYAESLQTLNNNHYRWKGNEFTVELEKRLMAVIKSSARDYQRITENTEIPELLAEIEDHLEAKDWKNVHAPAKTYAAIALHQLEQLLNDEHVPLKSFHRVPVFFFMRVFRAWQEGKIAEHAGSLQLILHFSQTSPQFTNFFTSTCQRSMNSFVATLAENNIRLTPNPMDKKVLRLLYRPNALIDDDVPILNFLVRGLLFGADEITSILFYRGLADKTGIMREYDTKLNINNPLWKLYLNFYPYYLYELRAKERESKKLQARMKEKDELGFPIESFLTPEQVADMVRVNPDQEKQVLLKQGLERLETLDELNKRIVLMKEVGDSSYTDIARELGISRQAIKKRYEKALKQLRHKLW